MHFVLHSGDETAAYTYFSLCIRQMDTYTGFTIGFIWTDYNKPN
jgi:hypothetical protein